MTDPVTDILEEIDGLLDVERAALLAGDFERIEALLPQKSARFEALSQAVPDADQDTEAGIAPLQVKLRRNRELFEQALAGLRAVSERVATLRSLREGAETYDVEGRRQSLDALRGGRLEKRA